MNLYLLLGALALLATMGAGLFNLARLPGRAEAVIVILLFGTTGVALIATLGFALNVPDALDVALVLAMLSAVLGVTFVLHSEAGGTRGDDS